MNWRLLLILGAAWLVTSGALGLAVAVLPRQLSRRRMWHQVRTALTERVRN